MNIYTNIACILMLLNINTLEAKEQKLLVPKNNSIYFGAFPDFGGSEDIISKKRINDFELLAGKKLAWAPFSQHWFNGLEYPKESIHTIHNQGIMPYVRFLPRSTLKQFKQEKKYTLENIIDGVFDKELKAWATEAKKDAIPIIMDFALEMNGDWFGWSGSFNGAEKKDGYGDKNLYDGAEKYRDAYRHIIDIFRDKGVEHITWFFHPTILTTPNADWNAPKNYYPGDDYIDWIGISIYGPFHPKENYWDTFDEILEESHKKILDISTVKPFAILELGVTDHHPLGSKPKWLKDAFSTILSKKYINFKGITYWHENWDNYGSLTSLKIDSSVESLKVFRKAIQDERFISTVELKKP